MGFLIASKSKVHCRANLTFVLRGAPCDFIRTSSVCSGKKTNAAEVGERAGAGVIHPVLFMYSWVARCAKMVGVTTMRKYQDVGKEFALCRTDHSFGRQVY